MKKIIRYSINSSCSFLIAFFCHLSVSAQIPEGHFIDIDDTAEKGIKLKPYIQKKKGIYHCAVLDSIPFENECNGFKKGKPKSKCLEETFSQIISAQIMGKPDNYEGYALVFCTVDINGKIVDIGCKSYPNSVEVNEIVKSTVAKLDVVKGYYKRKIVKSRLFARVDFER
ncbi:hypothetical protein [Maribacter sp. 2307UL18-2]|uniref:hypothetical protein n=1 Tax=Maribacter sp. 2307UL18-2 TaxID=3386274 RepID=UPI0039BC2E1D